MGYHVPLQSPRTDALTRMARVLRAVEAQRTAATIAKAERLLRPHQKRLLEMLNKQSNSGHMFVGYPSNLAPVMTTQTIAEMRARAGLRPLILDPKHELYFDFEKGFSHLEKRVEQRVGSAVFTGSSAELALFGRQRSGMSLSNAQHLRAFNEACQRSSLILKASEAPTRRFIAPDRDLPAPTPESGLWGAFDAVHAEATGRRVALDYEAAFFSNRPLMRDHMQGLISLEARLRSPDEPTWTDEPAWGADRPKKKWGKHRDKTGIPVVENAQAVNSNKQKKRKARK